MCVYVMKMNKDETFFKVFYFEVIFQFFFLIIFKFYFSIDNNNNSTLLRFIKISSKYFFIFIFFFFGRHFIYQFTLNILIQCLLTIIFQIIYYYFILFIINITTIPFHVFNFFTELF